MAVVGNAIINKYLTLSEAEAAFQPWWDALENYAVYAVVMLGKVLNANILVSYHIKDMSFIITLWNTLIAVFWLLIIYYLIKLPWL